MTRYENRPCEECGYCPEEDRDHGGSPWDERVDLQGGREIQITLCPDCGAEIYRYDPWDHPGGDQA